MPAGINHAGSRGGNASVMVVAESFERVSALVRASLGRAGIDNELAGDVIERAEHGNLRGLSLALARSRCRDSRKAASGCRKEKAPGDDPRAYANLNARASARGSELRGLLLSFGYR
jgi:hypothetical protein